MPGAAGDRHAIDVEAGIDVGRGRLGLVPGVADDGRGEVVALGDRLAAPGGFVRVIDGDPCASTMDGTALPNGSRPMSTRRSKRLN